MVREVQLDILHRNVLVVSAAAVVAAAVAAADAFAAAAVARGAMKPIVAVAREAVKLIVAVAWEAVKPIATVAREAVNPIAAVAALGAAKPTAVDDDDVDDLCRRVYRERCYGLHGPAEPRRRAPGRHPAALHLWPGHG